jgi:hypothetical protein
MGSTNDFWKELKKEIGEFADFSWKRPAARHRAMQGGYYAMERDAQERPA